MMIKLSLHFIHLIYVLVLLVLPCTTIPTLHDYELTTSAVGGGENASKRCVKEEEKALLEFKAGLVDVDGRLSNWTMEEDCCKWSGVVCNNRTGHVIKLDLQDQALGGEISPSLLKLRYLIYLDLSDNFFGAGRSIPKFIGSLTTLNYLNLSRNSFSGTIPPQLGNLTNLHHLAISSLYVENIEWLSHLTLLEYLNLEGTDFSKSDHWVDTIVRLPRLSSLSLSSCELSQVKFPYSSLLNVSSSITLLDLSWNYLTESTYDWLPNLISKRLRSLDLTGSLLGGIPKYFGNICSLESLSFVGNNLRDNSSLSDVLNNLTGCTQHSLTELDLSSCQIFGSLPNGIGKFSSLRSLRLEYNYLKGTLSEKLGDELPNLVHLNVHGNSISGFLPESLGQLSKLEYFDVSCNSLRGTLPESLWKLSNLEHLDVWRNSFSGFLPESFGQLSKLKYFVVSSNSLRGPVPESLGKLSNLRYLDLSSNLFEGVLSEVHMSNLSSLVHLDLANNSFTLELGSQWVPPFQLDYIRLSSCKLGPRFPKWLETQQKFSYLNIANSSISDTIPVGFWDLLPRQLTYLNLSFNKISGKVPDLSSKLYISSTIDLSSNEFDGSIPNILPAGVILNLSKNKFYGGLSFLCQNNYPILHFLDLSHNSLTGPLPDCFSELTELVILNLAHNNISGTIPSSIGDMVRLQVLSLYNNSFSGELPLALMYFDELSFLNLGVNRLSGNVPSWIGESLSGLYVLNLRSNNFFGPIPSQLCQLTNIQILDLSKNNLLGTIPPCLDNITAMVLKESSLGEVVEHQYMSSSIVTEGLENWRDIYVDYAMIVWQGIEREFTKINLGLLKIIDLSSNNLTGQIPKEITRLYALLSLNLSRNALSGEIPHSIGQISSLLSLDLSKNKLTGKIPSSMSGISGLGYLDLSDNNLSGKIPSGTQLSGFSASKYAGNPGLCGLPLAHRCPEDESPLVPATKDGNSSDEEGTDELWTWFPIGGAMGFISGFWGVCGALFLNRRWRHSFFLGLNNLQVYITILLRKLN